MGQSWPAVAAASVLLAFGIFMLVPFTQLLDPVGRKPTETVQVDIAPPPPPPPPEPPEEDEPEEIEEPPPSPPSPPPPKLSLAQLDLALEPGIGSAMEGAFSFEGFSAPPDAAAEMKDLFDVSELDEPLRVVNFERPEKPIQMRKDRIEGYTRVTFIVDRSGDVARIVGFDETTHKILESSVREVIGLWKFSPPTKNGRKVRARVIQPIRF